VLAVAAPVAVDPCVSTTVSMLLIVAVSSLSPVVAGVVVVYALIVVVTPVGLAHMGLHGHI